MDESDKIEFKKEYGKDRYIIINKHDLWNVDPYILYDLSHAIINYCMKTSNKSEKYYDYIDILGLENWDEEKLNDLEKAICYLIIFRSENFENGEVFKEKLRLEKFFN